MTKSRTAYPTDLNDSEYARIAPLVELQITHPRGAPRRVPIREILNAIFYVLKTGCGWRELPHDFPKWQTVYGYFRRFRILGIWELINQPVHRAVRQQAGREAQPSATILDCQTAHSAEGGEMLGFDGGKKIHGRKRVLLTDTLGFLVLVLVLAANVQDVHAGKQLLLVLQQRPELCQRLRKIYADGGFRGELVPWVKQALGVDLEIVLKPEGQRGFQVSPKRWVIERTNAWLTRQRRLARDYERLTASSEAFIYTAMVRLGLRRLSRISN
jgi:putative transposase